MPDEFSMGPLYWAILGDIMDAVASLVTRKANDNAAWTHKGERYDSRIRKPEFYPYGRSDFWSYSMELAVVRPLSIALLCSNVDILPALLKAGADPLAVTFKAKDESKSTAKAAVYVQNTAFDYVVARFALSKGSIREISPTFFANGFRLWQAVLALPKAKQPVPDKTLTANLFAYFASGDMKAFRAELVKTGENTLLFLPYAALAENWGIVDLILKYNSMEIDDPFDETG